MIQAYFSNFGLFEDEEVQHVVQLFEPKTLNKQDCFVREGEACTAIAYIRSGIFRSHYQATNGTEHTFCFRFPSTLMAPYSAFITGGPSVETMQAITDTELFVAKVDRMRDLVAPIPNCCISRRCVYRCPHALKVIDNYELSQTATTMQTGCSITPRT